MRFILPLSAMLLCSTTVFAKDISYQAGIDVSTDAATDAMARGTVFADANRNGTLDEGEAGIAGVLVSNGREVVTTNEAGAYELPAYEDMNLFITKPAGYSAPVDGDMIPQFNYVHKIAGSPDLRFGGIEATGPLPARINFPLIADDSARGAFECVVFGDAQPYFNMQVSYVRETAGRMLAARDNSNTECLLFEGDVMGDDLSLYPRFKQIISVGQVPQYYVAGNHDLDFDATTDADSFDTFRREFGPEYYSFDIGNVHFVVLDNVRYPCNGVDDHPFCAAEKKPTYNGVIHERQMIWLENDLANVPEDKLIVLSAHIPFQTFTDNTAAKHQTDNLKELADLLGDRPALGLSGHTHTTENIITGEYFEGWEDATGVGPAPFDQIVTGAVSGSWWGGSLNDDGVPTSTQRLGSPRGYYILNFDGSDYVDTYRSFTHGEDEQFHVSFNSPRYRDWAESLMDFVGLYGSKRGEILPPVSLNDLGDANMLTREDLTDNTWAVVNVWNGSAATKVSMSINGGEPMEALRTQSGTGEAKNRSIEYSDPYAVQRQLSDTRRALASASGMDGYDMFHGDAMRGHAGPVDSWLWTTASPHLWNLDLPADLPAGTHSLTVTVEDGHGRTFSDTIAFEVVEEIPQMTWQSQYWEDK